MPKLDLTRAIRIKGAGGEIIALKGPGFSWVKPAPPPTGTFTDDFDYAWEVLDSGAVISGGKYSVTSAVDSSFGDYRTTGYYPVESGEVYEAHIVIDSASGPFTIESTGYYFGVDYENYGYWTGESSKNTSVSITGPGTYLLHPALTPNNIFLQIAIEPSVGATFVADRIIFTKTS